MTLFCDLGFFTISIINNKSNCHNYIHTHGHKYFMQIFIHIYAKMNMTYHPKGYGQVLAYPYQCVFNKVFQGLET
jgi:hypothetical protein